MLTLIRCCKIRILSVGKVARFTGIVSGENKQWRHTPCYQITLRKSGLPGGVDVLIEHDWKKLVNRNNFLQRFCSWAQNISISNQYGSK